MSTKTIPSPCRRTDPYPPANKLDWRTAVTMGLTAAQAAIVKKVLARGHVVELLDGRKVEDAKSDGGRLRLRVAGIWVSEPVWFANP